MSTDLDRASTPATTPGSNETVECRTQARRSWRLSPATSPCEHTPGGADCEPVLGRVRPRTTPPTGCARRPSTITAASALDPRRSAGVAVDVDSPEAGFDGVYGRLRRSLAVDFGAPLRSTSTSVRTTSTTAFRSNFNDGRLQRPRSNDGRLQRRRSNDGRLQRPRSNDGRLQRRRPNHGRLQRRRPNHGRLQRRCSGRLQTRCARLQRWCGRRHWRTTSRGYARLLTVRPLLTVHGALDFNRSTLAGASSHVDGERLDPSVVGWRSGRGRASTGRPRFTTGRPRFTTGRPRSRTPAFDGRNRTPASSVLSSATAFTIEPAPTTARARRPSLGPPPPSQALETGVRATDA